MAQGASPFSDCPERERDLLEEDYKYEFNQAAFATVGHARWINYGTRLKDIWEDYKKKTHAKASEEAKRRVEVLDLKRAAGRHRRQVQHDAIAHPVRIDVGKVRHLLRVLRVRRVLVHVGGAQAALRHQH